MAGFFPRSMVVSGPLTASRQWSNDQTLACGLDHLLGNELKRVDLHDPRDLAEQPLRQMEVAPVMRAIAASATAPV